ncbi:MAG TPA: hypothetical protein VF494_04490 [Candidatus Limnocylindrales bacterium]
MTSTRRGLLSLTLAGGLLLGVASGVAAHDTTVIAVDPNPATAGDEVTLGVTGIDPNQDRAIVLVGQGIVVTFPSVRTDATGAFSTTVTLPSRLPGGTYRFEVIGDETLTGDIDVEAVAGGIAAQPPADQPMPASRARTPIELGVILVLAGAAGVVGLVLVLRAERFRDLATG